MKAFKQYREGFNKFARAAGLAAFASFAPVTTAVLPTTATAQTQAHTTQAEVNDFIRAMRAYQSRYSNYSNTDYGNVNALYVNIHRFFLSYNGQNYSGSHHNVPVYATALARLYGLENSREYRDFINAVERHSNFAETYMADSGLNLVNERRPEFMGMKFQAIIEVQSTAAAFMERVLPYVPNPQTISNDLHTVYGRACYITQSMTRNGGEFGADTVLDVIRSVQSKNGIAFNSRAYTIETRSGRSYTCPPPRSDTEKRRKRHIPNEM